MRFFAFQEHHKHYIFRGDSLQTNRGSSHFLLDVIFWRARSPKGQATCLRCCSPGFGWDPETGVTWAGGLSSLNWHLKGVVFMILYTWDVYFSVCCLLCSVSMHVSCPYKGKQRSIFLWLHLLIQPSLSHLFKYWSLSKGDHVFHNICTESIRPFSWLAHL